MMSYQISTENAAFLRRQVECGAFHDSNEGLNAAVDLLRKRASLSDRLEQACQQVDAGEFVEMDEKKMDEFFRDLEAIATGENF